MNIRIKKGLFLLLLSEIDGDGHSFEIVDLPQLVFQIPAIRVSDILRQVGKKGELRGGSRQLHTVFYFHKFPFDRWRRILLNDVQHGLV